MNNENNSDRLVLQEFIAALARMVERKISSDLNNANIEYAFKGIVTDYNSETNTAVVDIGESTTDYIPNLTGEETLSVGDTVKVFSDKRNMVGAYIGVKLAAYTETTE